MTQSKPEAAPARPARSLREICRRIEAGYRAGTTMFDAPMLSLVEELTGRTTEIVDLLDVLVDLDEYNTFDLSHVEVDDTYVELKTKAHDLAVANRRPVSQLFADPAGCLVETTDPDADPVEFSPQGGGFVYRMKQDRFRETFKRAEKPAIRKARFTADWLPSDMSLEAYTNDMRRNGWGMPSFTFEEAQRLMPQMPGLSYDATADAFVMKNEGDAGGDETFAGESITVDGNAVKVYPIGAGSWCWDPPK